MKESVQLDLKGDMHIDFEDAMLVYVRTGYARIRLPARINSRQVTANTHIFYCDIQWIGEIVRRQWWLLFPGMFFTIFGPIWMCGYLGDWEPFAISIIWFVVLGIFPFILLSRGRTYLGIATEDKIVIFPMDRQQKKIRRILGLLKQSCPSAETRWQLDGTHFENPDSWDNRPATGKGFDQKRYIRISTLAGLYGLANLLHTIPKIRLTAEILWLAVVAIAVFWGIQALCNKFKSGNTHRRM